MFSCREKPKEKLSTLVHEHIFNKNALIEKLTQEAIRHKRQSPEITWADTLYDFYEARKFEPVWALGLADSSKRKDLLQFINNAKQEGLDPAWYGYKLLDDYFSKLNDFLPSDSLYIILAQTEWKISHALLSMHFEHSHGRLDPYNLFGIQYQLPKRVVHNFNLFEIIDATHFKQVYVKSKPQNPAYDSLMHMLRYYQNMWNEGTRWSQIDTTGIIRIDPGDTTIHMPAVALKMYELGFLDSSYLTHISTTQYEKSFARHIRKFQSTYGLHDDGIIGRNTLHLLNRSIKDLKDEICANLERIRWFEVDTSIKPYLWVNQPEFMLYMHYHDSVKAMRVCIGKQNSHDYDVQYAKYQLSKKFSDKPKNFETPQIYSWVSHMVLNPTWTVPSSIVSREMYPQMRRDKNYLRRNNYTVIYKDKPVPNQDTINWSRYSATNIPYKFVQGAGDDNALGMIKFIFQNPFYIYMHDTPQKSKFNLTERSVSHGCVRVEQPLTLALFLSQHIVKYNYDDMRIMMGYPPVDSLRLANYDPLDSMAKLKKITKTTTVILNRSIPVYFDYRTIWWDNEGKLQMRNDVYRRNSFLMEAMRKKTYFAV